MPQEQTLATKYNLPTPRYTSYPTVPFWNDGPDIDRWKNVFTQQCRQANEKGGISLYIHLPFCESLCTYCGCTKKITANHSVEERYIDAVLKEWELYLALMPERPIIRELHLGGGTPTFFSPENLCRLVKAILGKVIIHRDHVFSLEGHPNNTTRKHLDALYALGFRRISYGIQDTNPEVQKAINRIQPFENVIRATDDARAAGFTSVNFDLIYGLPRQDADDLIRSISRCLSLHPDRIAYYSYAHLPAVNCGQRLIDEKDLPSAVRKLDLYQKGREFFLCRGYTDIGMDHFALPTDELYKAWKKGTLHRNFMGYTAQRTDLLLGLGMSSISDGGKAYVQNSKVLSNYYQAIEAGVLPLVKGYFLTEEDEVFRGHILDIACQGRTHFNEKYEATMRRYVFPALLPLEKDGLILLNEKGLIVTSRGRDLLRIICKAFDLHLLRREMDKTGASSFGPCGKSGLSGGIVFSNAI